MRFVRSRKSFIFLSFGFVILLFLVTHWRSYKLLVEKIHDERVTHDQNIKFGSHDQLSRKMTQQNCSPESGLQTSAHCKKKGVLGVAPSNASSYQPNQLGFFACFDGELSISWASVNDDYCDCPDGSDEPGTGACPNTRFYCIGENRYLPSSRINDGICDCCDGSDEWKKETVREDVLQKHNFDIKYVPCANFC